MPSWADQTRGSPFPLSVLWCVYDRKSLQNRGRGGDKQEEKDDGDNTHRSIAWFGIVRWGHHPCVVYAAIRRLSPHHAHSCLLTFPFYCFHRDTHTHSTRLITVLLISHAQNDFRRAIISRHHVGRHHEGRVRGAGQPEIQYLQSAVGPDDNIAGLQVLKRKKTKKGFYIITVETKDGADLHFIQRKSEEKKDLEIAALPLTSGCASLCLEGGDQSHARRHWKALRGMRREQRAGKITSQIEKNFGLRWIFRRNFSALRWRILLNPTRALAFSMTFNVFSCEKEKWRNFYWFDKHRKNGIK